MSNSGTVITRNNCYEIKVNCVMEDEKHREVVLLVGVLYR